MEKSTMKIDANLHKDVKIEAAKQSMSLGDLAEALISDGLKRLRARKLKLKAKPQPAGK